MNGTTNLAAEYAAGVTLSGAWLTGQLLTAYLRRALAHTPRRNPR